MSAKIKFTQAALTKIDPPTDRRNVFIYDTARPGLALMVTRAGAKVFYFYRRIGPRPERIRLGAFPPMTVDQARDAFDRQNGQVAKGSNPAEDRRVERDQIKLDELLHRYIDQHAKIYKRTWEDDEAQLVRYFGFVKVEQSAPVEATDTQTDQPTDDAKPTTPAPYASWRARTVASFEMEDIQSLHSGIGQKHGKYAANRALALLSTVFNFAGKIGVKIINPAKGVTRFREESRERVVHADEMPALLKSIEAHPDKKLADFFLLALYTGARRANLEAMTWSDVNFSRRVWTIPASQAKAGKVLSVYLSDAAVEVLRRRWSERAQGEAFVFPGRGKTGHLTEPKMAWAEILKRARLTDLRLHDLRRTYGTWLAAGGASLHMIGKALGHQNVSTTAIYARLSLDPLKAPIEAATAAMRAMNVTPTVEGGRSTNKSDRAG